MNERNVENKEINKDLKRRKKRDDGTHTKRPSVFFFKVLAHKSKLFLIKSLQMSELKDNYSEPRNDG